MGFTALLTLGAVSIHPMQSVAERIDKAPQTEDHRLLAAIQTRDVGRPDISTPLLTWMQDQANFPPPLRQRIAQRALAAIKSAQDQDPTPFKEMVEIFLGTEQMIQFVLFWQQDLSETGRLRYRQALIVGEGPDRTIGEVLGVSDEQWTKIEAGIKAAQKSALNREDDNARLTATARGIDAVLQQHLTEPQKKVYERLTSLQLAKDGSAILMRRRVMGKRESIPAEEVPAKIRILGSCRLYAEPSMTSDSPNGWAGGIVEVKEGVRADGLTWYRIQGKTGQFRPEGLLGGTSPDSGWIPDLALKAEK